MRDKGLEKRGKMESDKIEILERIFSGVTFKIIFPYYVFAFNTL